MFKDITPSSILISNNIEGLAEGADSVFSELFNEVVNVIIYPRIDKLPEEVIDLLAWQFHVDEYHVAKTLEEKRNIVKRAIELHRYKGTKYSVEETLKWLLSIDAEVQEWFEYGGEPYRFNLLVKSTIESPEKWNDILKVVISYKNVRSWLDTIKRLIDYSNKIYTGVLIKTTRIQNILIHFEIPDLENQIGVGGAHKFSKKTTIPSTNKENLSITADIFVSTTANNVQFLRLA